MLRVPQSPTCPHRRSASSSSADTSSPPASPSRLRMAGVANLFVRARRAQRRVVFGQQQVQQEQQQDQQQRQQKPSVPGQIIFTSGEPKTHPTVELSMQSSSSSSSSDKPHYPVELAESFVCQGGVNVLPLLMATRNDLLDRTEAAFGAATLTDEQWECIITEPKAHSNSIYKVQVRYNACATWCSSSSSVRNPTRPVCIEQAGCVPGLMTILKRRIT